MAKTKAPAATTKAPGKTYRWVGYTWPPQGGKATFTLTQRMIDLRDGIARGMGYERVRCTVRPEPGNFDCWERVEKTWPIDGHMTSSMHAVSGPMTRPNDLKDGLPCYQWPPDVEVAGWKIDKGKPLAGDPGEIKPEPETPAPAVAPQAELFGGSKGA